MSANWKPVWKLVYKFKAFVLSTITRLCLESWISLIQQLTCAHQYASF